MNWIVDVITDSWVEENHLRVRCNHKNGDFFSLTIPKLMKNESHWSILKRFEKEMKQIEAKAMNP